MTSAAQFRKLALAMPGAEEKSQSAVLGSDAYSPAAGAWGTKGWTQVDLSRVKAAELAELIRESFGLVAPKQQKSQEVEAFIKALKHPFKKELEAILEGNHRDRRAVKFHSTADVRKKQRALQQVVRAWVTEAEQR